MIYGSKKLNVVNMEWVVLLMIKSFFKICFIHTQKKLYIDAVGTFI